jgi:hypothetical protein
VAARTGISSRVRHDTSFTRRVSSVSMSTTETDGLTNTRAQRTHRHSSANAWSRTRVSCIDAHCGQRCSIGSPTVSSGFAYDATGLVMCGFSSGKPKSMPDEISAASPPNAAGLSPTDVNSQALGVRLNSGASG